jgi:hypothetical protein
MGFQPAVLAQQVVEVAVEEAVLPDQLEQRVHEKPGVFHVAHAVAGVEQFAQGFFVAVEQRVDELVFGGVVVVEVAGADVELGRDQVVDTLGSPKRLKRSRVTSRIRSAVRRGAFFAISCLPRIVL